MFGLLPLNIEPHQSMGYRADMANPPPREHSATGISNIDVQQAISLQGVELRVKESISNEAVAPVGEQYLVDGDFTF